MKFHLGSVYRAVRKVIGNPGLVLPRKQPLGFAPSIEGERFVFIAGLHRSGTSLLHRLLREHGDTSGFSNTRVPEDEGQYLQTIYTKDSASGGPGRFASDPTAHLTESSPLVSDDNAKKMVRQWGAYYDLEKKILLEKSPANLIRTRFFQALFPGAKFVFIIRHPIPVGLSTHNWTRRNGIGLPEVMGNWVKAHQLFLEDLPHISNQLVIRYEDLIANPASTLDTVYRFIGLEPALPKEDLVDSNGKYFGRWEREIDDRQSIVEGITEKAGPGFFDQFGYSFSEPYVSQECAWNSAGDEQSSRSARA